MPFYNILDSSSTKLYAIQNENQSESSGIKAVEVQRVKLLVCASMMVGIINKGMAIYQAFSMVTENNV